MKIYFPGPVDVERWGRADYWDLIEAVHILADIEPNPYPHAMVAPETEPIYDLLVRSIRAANYPPIRDRIGDRLMLLPIEVLDWAKDKGIAVCPRLVELSLSTYRANEPRLRARQAADLRSIREAGAISTGEPTDDAAYGAAYKRAWELYDELEKWKGMKHGGDPIRAIQIEKRLAEINAELKTIDSGRWAAGTSSDDKAAFAPKQRSQEAKPRANAADWEGRKRAVLEALIEAGYDPMNLPMTDAGKDGPTAKLRELLCGEHGRAFVMSDKNVEKTLKRLRDDGRVRGGGLTSVSTSGT